MAKRIDRQISVAAELQSLATLRAWIDQACDEHPFIDEQSRYDLKLAVDEACANIIQYGYAGMDPGSIILELEISPQRVDIAITDFGHPFEPVEVDIPDLEAGIEDLPPGGFGIFFIYQAMDEISYEASQAGNKLYFVKHLPSAP